MAKTKNIKDALVSEEKAKKAKKVKEVEVEKEEVELEPELEENDEVKGSKKETKKIEKKETVKKENKKSKDKKEGFVSSVIREMKKVVWPSFGDIVKYSFAVIIFCVVLCLFFEGLTMLSAFVKGLFR